MGYYLNQLKALVKRNILLKKASKATIVLEIFFPIYSILCIFLISFILKQNSGKNESTVINSHEPTILSPLYSLFSKSYDYQYSVVGFVLPEENDGSIIPEIVGTINNDFFNSTSYIKPMQFKNQEEMVKYKTDKDKDESSYDKLLAGIVFESNDLSKYTIRLNIKDVENPETEPITNVGSIFSLTSSEELSSQYINIFSPIQSSVDQALIRMKTKDNNFSLNYSIGELGQLESNLSESDMDISASIGYYITFSFLAVVYTITLNIVKEKEDKLRDGLLIAGVHPTVFWLSWFILEGFITFIISVVFTIIIVFNNLIPNVNFIFIFLVIFLFSLSACCIGFIFSTFFKKSKTAGVVIIFFYIILCYMNQILILFNSNISRILSFIFSTVSLGLFFNSAIKLKYTYKSLGFVTIFKTDVGFYLLITLFNVVTYFLLAIILDNLISNENNRYLFTPKRKVKDLHSENEVTYQKDIQEDFNSINNEKCMVEVSRVHKLFKRDKNNSKNDNNNNNNKNQSKGKNSEFLAVNDISFKVYQNEIFALLGHNGAGKTTLINIMVGLIKATYGDVYFDGSSISKNVNAIRKDFGVCAQTNIIYDGLTVEDHINFYANLKNVKVDVDEVLKELDLLPQKKLKSSKLSGGQKRKLCIGMAIIGNPKYIFLDEPTTGLDPLSRRKIWELLLKKKEGRVIFLTTHYMDEADVLADRKLILNKGKIRCLGTSLYLKNHFNMKYNLDVETNEKEKVNKIIMNYLPEAIYVENKEANEFESHDNKFYTWRLPLNSSDHFAPLLNELDNLSGSLIRKYALSLPTLEELFIRLEDDQINNSEKEKSNNNIDNEYQYLIQTNDNSLPELKSVPKPSNSKLISTLVKYRLKIFLKDKMFAFNAFILPILLIALVFFGINQLMFKERIITYESKAITVPSMYPETKINYSLNSTLPITTENILSGVGNDISGVSNVLIEQIQYPRFEDAYYLSSLGGEMVESENKLNVEIYYNSTMPHSLPASLNTVSNAFLASKNISDRIIVNNQPFDEKQDNVAMVGLTFIGFIIGIGVVSVLNKFGPLISRERINQLLLQLQLNGVSRFNYWISNLITDDLLFLCTCTLIILSGVVIRFEPLLDVSIVLLVLCFIIIWSIPCMLYQYIISFMFKKEETAFTGISAINTYPIIFGFFGLVILNANTSSSNLDALYSNTAIIFCLCFTALCPSFGIVVLLNALFTLKLFSSFNSSELSMKTIMNYHNIISPLIALLIVLLFVYYFILILLDRMKNQTNKSDISELPPKTSEIYEKELENGDDDVKREYEYVKEHQNELPISTLHLCKEFNVSKGKITDPSEIKEIRDRDANDYTYGDIHKSIVKYNQLVKTAVVDVNFGVRLHECFGLLGPNGAGKSTTLNIVSSTIPQTIGSVCYNGVETHQAKLGDVSMGYCPQHDILWKELTLREHIEFFLSIRGYDSDDAKVYATQYINAAGLEEHQNKRVDDLSGGTKRKLSILIAICGYPERILLDEPTAGMDPSTRRLIWEIIKSTKRRNDSALIMTTHSMEEAEQLCDRLAILVNGRLICIGSPEHLKMKYGKGYILELQCNDVDQFHSEVVEKCNLFNSHEYKMERISNNRGKYEVKMTKKLGLVFERMEEYKKKGLVNDYSFNQTSLEQIFINFAKNQIISN
ncbi:P-loop containing nucleoside triphosphate hydrolase protein [Piromyces finnis]|uniref:p-loop containing nucleoside triphosphate hydrolase protein n=1 Tax=Piromyces finnis TaxID=1754191 RepID=A0A1Y1UZH8_9FUNG|nr:P-loop containing nucleoside triphosphate hydrolase protein [Piromyces finnis]|eukprot:ORX43294.1 P-loop containing nucleoside triphosphate hydrolase protein [Piromyces finnis]